MLLEFYTWGSCLNCLTANLVLLRPLIQWSLLLDVNSETEVYKEQPRFLAHTFPDTHILPPGETVLYKELMDLEWTFQLWHASVLFTLGKDPRGQVTSKERSLQGRNVHSWERGDREKQTALKGSSSFPQSDPTLSSLEKTHSQQQGHVSLSWVDWGRVQPLRSPHPALFA